jgi:hypothetical protein
VSRDELDCAIYVDAPSEDVLTPLLPDDPPGAELYVDASDEADPAQRTAFPDGFLAFSHRVEVFADAPPAVDLVTGMLERLWAAGLPAVAACDYEDRLPHGGGYGSRDVPWPV